MVLGIWRWIREVVRDGAGADEHGALGRGDRVGQPTPEQHLVQSPSRQPPGAPIPSPTRSIPSTSSREGGELPRSPTRPRTQGRGPPCHRQYPRRARAFGGGGGRRRPWCTAYPSCLLAFPSSAAPPRHAAEAISAADAPVSVVHPPARGTTAGQSPPLPGLTRS